jgi:DNA-binding MarR family transcriptional regulator
MPPGFERCLIGMDFGIERVGVGAFCGTRKMFAFVPIFDAAPDHRRNLCAKGKALAAPRRCLAQAGEAKNIRLVRCYFAGHDILDNRIGARRAEGYRVKLRHAHHVAQRVSQPVGVVFFKKIRLADCERIDRAEMDIDPMTFGKRPISADRKIAVRRAKRPEKVSGQSHVLMLGKLPRSASLVINSICYYSSCVTENIGFLLNDSARLFRRAFNARAKDSGITALQWRLLVYLVRNSGIRQGPLAALIEVEPITLSRMVDRLAEAGLVERRADPADRRAWRLFPTPLAEARLEAMRAVVLSLMDEATEGMSGAEIAELTRLVARMQLNLSQRVARDG